MPTHSYMALASQARPLFFLLCGGGKNKSGLACETNMAHLIVVTCQHQGQYNLIVYTIYVHSLPFCSVGPFQSENTSVPQTCHTHENYQHQLIVLFFLLLLTSPTHKGAFLIKCIIEYSIPSRAGLLSCLCLLQLTRALYAIQALLMR